MTETDTLKGSRYDCWWLLETYPQHIDSLCILSGAKKKYNFMRNIRALCDMNISVKTEGDNGDYSLRLSKRKANLKLYAATMETFEPKLYTDRIEKRIVANKRTMGLIEILPRSETSGASFTNIQNDLGMTEDEVLHHAIAAKCWGFKIHCGYKNVYDPSTKQMSLIMAEDEFKPVYRNLKQIYYYLRKEER